MSDNRFEAIAVGPIWFTFDHEAELVFVYTHKSREQGRFSMSHEEWKEFLDEVSSNR